jgi:hypothetical protein
VLVDAVPLVFVVTGLVVITANVLVGGGSLVGAGAAVALLLAAVVTRVGRVSWWIPITVLLLVILFIPIRRYVMTAGIGFQLEPYRVLVGAILFTWFCALLADPRVRVRRTGFDAPLLCVLMATLGSVIVNMSRVSALESQVIKSVVFFLSFLLIVYFLSSVLRGYAEVELLVKVLVAGGAAVAILALIEARTGYTPFNSLSSVLPFMHLDPAFEPVINRGARLRAFGPAEHPIALGVMLAMLIPLAVHLGRTASRVWSAMAVVLVVGALGTVSRTSVLVLVAMLLVFIWMRPRETLRLWPLVIVFVLATHIAAPGTLGTLKEAFLPAGGLIAEQQSSPGSSGSGRLADLGPSLDEWARSPVLGRGYGTRTTTGSEANASVIDDQWLSTLLETGAAGVAAWVWLFVLVLGRGGRAARKDRSPRGGLLVALVASIAGYAVAMFTFDAFSFIQVTFLLFVLLGFAAVLLRGEAEPAMQWQTSKQSTATVPIGGVAPRLDG